MAILLGMKSRLISDILKVMRDHGEDVPDSIEPEDVTRSVANLSLLLLREPDTIATGSGRIHLQREYEGDEYLGIGLYISLGDL